MIGSCISRALFIVRNGQTLLQIEGISGGKVRGSLRADLNGGVQNDTGRLDRRKFSAVIKIDF